MPQEPRTMLSDNRACAVARLTATVPQPGWHGTVWGGQQACHAAQKPHEQARSLGVLEQVRTHGSKLEMSRSTIRICSNGYTATVLQPEQYRAELDRIRFRTRMPETAQLSGISQQDRA